MLGMPARRREFLSRDHFAGAVIVEPVFARLEAGNDRMAGGVKMFRGVLRGRAVTATHVAALGAAPQVEPPSAGMQTLLAALAAGRHFGIDACALRLHLGSVPFRRNSARIVSFRRG